MGAKFIRDGSAGLEKMFALGPKERIQAMLKVFFSPDNGYYDSKLLSTVKLIDASEGRTEWEFTVTEDMCNANGTLHGGCAATILDCLTSMPAYTIAKPGFLDGGTMSRTLSLTYLRALPAGEKVKVICEVVHAGKTLCHMKGDIVRQDGTVAVSCSHDKVPRHKPKL